MGSAFHQMCPRYSGTLTPTAPTAIRLWETYTFTFTCIVSASVSPKPFTLHIVPGHLSQKWGWSGGVMVLGKLPVPGRPINFIIWIRVGQGPTALAMGASGGCFTLVYHYSFLSPSLWETARYRLKYCLKGPLSPE